MIYRLYQFNNTSLGEVGALFLTVVGFFFTVMGMGASLLKTLTVRALKKLNRYSPAAFTPLEKRLRKLI